jgi:hypothetical protein
VLVEKGRGIPHDGRRDAHGAFNRAEMSEEITSEAKKKSEEMLDRPIRTSGIG